MCKHFHVTVCVCVCVSLCGGRSVVSDKECAANINKREIIAQMGVCQYVLVILHSIHSRTQTITQTNAYIYCCVQTNPLFFFKLCTRVCVSSTWRRKNDFICAALPTLTRFSQTLTCVCIFSCMYVQTKNNNNILSTFETRVYTHIRLYICYTSVGVCAFMSILVHSIFLVSLLKTLFLWANSYTYPHNCTHVHRQPTHICMPAYALTFACRSSATSQAPLAAKLHAPNHLISPQRRSTSSTPQRAALLVLAR